jgi:outer membrane protein OmpA-like peptidoglycan-associated protein
MSTGFDKVGKPGSVGPAGLIDISTPDVWNRVDLRTRTIMVRLYNYNIDGNTLKPEHQQFLRDRLVPFVRSVPSHIKLHGTASQSGDATYNRQLSLERVLRVKQFLTSCGLTEGQVPGTQMQATGEDQSKSKSSEDAWDRAVTLVIAARVLSRPIRRPRPEAKPKPHPPIG